jgi:hypothetical protein
MNKDTGLTLDQMLPGVVQAGFIHDQGRISGGELTSRPEDLANLLREEESGNRQFRLGAEDARATQALSRKRQELMTDLNAELHGLGTSYASLPKKMTDRALYIMYADGKDAETAYNQAIMEQDYYAEKAGTIRRHPANKTENEPAGPSGAGPDDTRGQRAGGTSAGARSAGEVGRQESWRTLSDLARDDAAEREALEASKAADAVPMPASITKDKALAAATAAEQAAAEEVKLHYDAGTLPEATKQALDDELLKIDQTTKDWSNALETATTCLIGGMFGTI